MVFPDTLRVVPQRVAGWPRREPAGRARAPPGCGPRELGQLTPAEIEKWVRRTIAGDLHPAPGMIRATGAAPWGAGACRILAVVAGASQHSCQAENVHLPQAVASGDATLIAYERAAGRRRARWRCGRRLRCHVGVGRGYGAGVASLTMASGGSTRMASRTARS
jgi:hypothetical protein